MTYNVVELAGMRNLGADGADILHNNQVTLVSYVETTTARITSTFNLFSVDYWMTRS